MTAIHIGISGWRYTPWRGDFYPKGLTQKRELQFASRAVNSIEINGSFYALQRPERYAQWYAETPPGFVFSVKAPRFITHIKRLRDIHKPLANFFASGVLELKEKLGAILWQFPPSRSEEHTSELQSLMRISYAVFCLKKKTQQNNNLTRQNAQNILK